VHQWHTTDGMAFLMADSAFYRAANLQKLAQTPMKWITRVPAILNPGKTVLAQTDPQALASLKAGYHYHELTSPYGGIEARWVLISSESRPCLIPRTSSRCRASAPSAEFTQLNQ
jgi:transposase